MSEEPTTDKMLVPIAQQPVTMRTLETLSALPTTPKRYRGKPLDMWACALQGRELGLGPITAVNNLFLVDGQSAMYAKTMAGLIFSKGHVYAINATDKIASITCHRYHPRLNQMFEVGTLHFTMEDAERAGLVTIDEKGIPRARSEANNAKPWELYPAQMLTNRVLSWAARLFYADCILGIGYVPEEVRLEDESPIDLLVVDEEEEKVPGDNEAGYPDAIDYRTRSSW